MSEKLRNIGPKSMAWLRQTGVRTLDDLKAVGALAAYVRVKRAGFKPSLNLLYALEGAILDCHWQEIPDERRSVLILQADEAVALLPQPKGKRMPVAGPVTTTRNDEEDHASLPDPDNFGGFEEPSAVRDDAG
jgi:DNA transformation protein and related proteins